MAKWSGDIGFAVTRETKPGIWEEIITVRHYYGDFIKNTRSINNVAVINDTVNIANQISFVADPYARKNFLMIRYITFMGIKWKVRNIEVQYPRLIANLGDVYNEEQR